MIKRLLCVLLIALFAPVYVFAADTGEIKVPVSLYSDIDLTEEDSFRLTVEGPNGKIERIINPVQIEEGLQFLYMPEGEYTGATLQYLGTNPEIITGGYAIDPNIKVTAEKTKGISFYVGKDQIKKAGKKKLLKGTSTATTEKMEETTAAASTKKTEEPETKVTTEAGNTKETVSPETKTSAKKEEKTESKAKDEKKAEAKHRSPLFRLIPIAAIVLIVGGATFIWYGKREKNS